MAIVITLWFRKSIKIKRLKYLIINTCSSIPHSGLPPAVRERVCESHHLCYNERSVSRCLQGCSVLLAAFALQRCVSIIASMQQAANLRARLLYQNLKVSLIGGETACVFVLLCMCVCFSCTTYFLPLSLSVCLNQLSFHIRSSRFKYFTVFHVMSRCMSMFPIHTFLLTI